MGERQGRFGGTSILATDELARPGRGYDVQVSSTFRHAAHQQMRTAVLDLAADDVLHRGWSALQMRSIAERVGVSRQTLYNAFGDKHGLAKALTMRITDEFLDGVQDAIEANETLEDQLEALVGFALDKAADDDLFRAFLADRSDEFLRLLTSDGAPVLSAARERITTGLLAGHPELDRHRVADAAECVTRLAISHMVLPSHPASQAAQLIAALAARHLRADGHEAVTIR